jgi:hypothetical protein
MSNREGSVFARIQADGAAATISADERGAPDAAFVAGRIRAALALAKYDVARIVAVWDEAGARHDPATLDEVIAELTAGGWVPIIGALSKRKLRASARIALAATDRAGTVELATAVLGASGTKDDVAALETLARHPSFTLHAATALSNLDHWQGRASLLRLLAATNGAERVVVIDRLLPHIREPAVRLALVRDALTGLAPEHAREVAPDIAAMLDVKSLAEDPKAPAEIRAGARAVLAACPRDAE